VPGYDDSTTSPESFLLRDGGPGSTDATAALSQHSLSDPSTTPELSPASLLGYGGVTVRDGVVTFDTQELPDKDCFVEQMDGTFRCSWPKCQTQLKEGQPRGESNKHLRKHVRPVLCPCCSERRAEQRGMKRHVISSHYSLAMALNLDMSRTWCPLCERSYTRYDNCLRHMRKKHPQYRHRFPTRPRR
jgi:hypothetical protein